MNNDIKRPMFCRNVDSFPLRQVLGTRYVLVCSTSHAEIHGKFSHDLYYKVDKSSAWNLPERKWINIPAKHRPLGFIPWKQQKATWAQSNHFNVDYDQWANKIEHFSYIMTTSNLHLLVFDTSRKSTQISCSLKLNSKTKPYWTN